MSKIEDRGEFIKIKEEEAIAGLEMNLDDYTMEMKERMKVFNPGGFWWNKYRNKMEYLRMCLTVFVYTIVSNIFINLLIGDNPSAGTENGIAIVSLILLVVLGWAMNLVWRIGYRVLDFALMFGSGALASTIISFIF